MRQMTNHRKRIVGLILLIGGAMTAVYFFESELFPLVKDSVIDGAAPQYGLAAVRVVMGLAAACIGLRLIRIRPGPRKDGGN